MNLYIVSTPIGNLQDITLRAARTLLESKIIIAESASKAGILIDFLKKEFPQIDAPKKHIISLTEDEEELKLASIFQIIETGDSSLISEAGTPLISDPGYKLVREAIKRNIRIIPIPGPTALVTGLTASGLPTDKFLFIGYLPKKEGKKSQILEDLREFRAKLVSTYIIYESPHRLVGDLVGIQKIFGDIDVAICRELTKIHEEVRREKISSSIEYYKKANPKGEFVILF